MLKSAHNPAQCVTETAKKSHPAIIAGDRGYRYGLDIFVLETSTAPQGHVLLKSVKWFGSSFQRLLFRIRLLTEFQSDRRKKNMSAGEISGLLFS